MTRRRTEAPPQTFDEWLAATRTRMDAVGSIHDAARWAWNEATESAARLVEDTLVSKNYITGEPDAKTALADAADLATKFSADVKAGFRPEAVPHEAPPPPKEGWLDDA